MLRRTAAVTAAVGGRTAPRRGSRWTCAVATAARGARRTPVSVSAAVAQATSRGAAHAAGRPRGTATTTRLGAYLEACGATWAEAVDVHEVVAGGDGRSFSWRVDLPEERLRTLRRGDLLESPSFVVGSGRRVRFQFFPKGDLSGSGDDGQCSLWLFGAADIGPVSLRLGQAPERPGGASDFAVLEDALGGSSSLEISLRFADEAPAETAEEVKSVQQSLKLTGLEQAEWEVFQTRELVERGELHTSPPFRFHHVLLGDMYLELLPRGEGLCALFFRCRVPTMRLRVNLSVGTLFSKSFEALGKASHEDDLKAGTCLQVNLDAPGVLAADGSLQVTCVLEEVVSIPTTLRDMIPKLDERALWPKRL